MGPANRLLDLLNLLRARKTLTATELSRELGVSVRTVYRDIDDLRETGVPIAGEAGVGYRLQAGYDLPPLTFDTDELAALVTGMRLVFRDGDPDLAAAARRALHKIEAVLPESLRDHIRQAAVYVPRRDSGAFHLVAPIRDEPSVMGALRAAIDARRRVAITYTDHDGAPSERTIRPVGLFLWDRTWTVAAWCETRLDWRSFRPDRIRDCQVLDDSWTEPGHTLDAFVRMMAMRPRPKSDV